MSLSDIAKEHLTRELANLNHCAEIYQDGGLRELTMNIAWYISLKITIYIFCNAENTINASLNASISSEKPITYE